jgi:ribonuclease HI
MVGSSMFSGLRTPPAPASPTPPAARPSVRPSVRPSAEPAAPRPTPPAPVKPPLVAATDGACRGNPGPGGWAWYVDERNWAAGGSPRTTNNAMELAAVKEVLAATRDCPDRPLVLQVDSQYTIDALTKWIHGWRRNGWQTGAGRPVANQKLIAEIDVLLSGRRVTFEKVKGHSGHLLNEAADQKACLAADDARVGPGQRFGPGLTSG